MNTKVLKISCKQSYKVFHLVKVLGNKVNQMQITDLKYNLEDKFKLSLTQAKKKMHSFSFQQAE